MARYTDESRERVRDAVDFAEVVGARTELRQAGSRRMTGLCPFHDERTPSFGIDPVAKLYHCFGCGQGGDVFRFVMETEGLDFGAALETLADRYRVTLERVEEDPRAAARRERRERLLALLERTAAWYVRMLWESAEAASAREYLASRGLGEGALRAFRVGYAPKGWDKVLVASRRAGYSEEELLAAGLVQRAREGRVYDRFRGRLMFPLADERGRVLGFGARLLAANGQEGGRPGPKYLNSPEGETFTKGEVVYGFDLARASAARAGSVVVCEGYTDVIALHQAGMEQTVAIMGTALTEAQARKLAQLAPSVVLCLDADAAGREAMTRASSLLSGGRRELRVVPLPVGQDPADIVAADGGADAMRALLAGAVPVARFAVDRALEHRDPEHALRDAAEVIRPLPPSVLRDELVRLVADRLSLSDALVTAALVGSSAPPDRSAAGEDRDGGWRGGGRGDGARRDGGGGAWRGEGRQRDGARGGPNRFRGGDRRPAGDRRGGGRPGGWDRSAPGGLDASRPDFDPSYYEGFAAEADEAAQGGAAGAVFGRREQTEIAFLALCVASPDEGERRLGDVDLDELFGSPMVRRAAVHLRGRLRTPAADLPVDDEPLARLIAELVVRAGDLDPSPQALVLEGLQLDLASLDRRMAEARATRDGAAVRELAGERQRVLDEIRHRFQ